MKKYLHNGKERIPFDFEELKSKNKQRLPVWSAGMEDWKQLETGRTKSLYH
jgi:hypothetical protein